MSIASISATSLYSSLYLSASSSWLLRFLMTASWSTRWSASWLSSWPSWPVLSCQFIQLGIQSDLFSIEILLLWAEGLVLFLLLLHLISWCQQRRHSEEAPPFSPAQNTAPSVRWAPAACRWTSSSSPPSPTWDAWWSVRRRGSSGQWSGSPSGRPSTWRKKYLEKLDRVHLVKKYQAPSSRSAIQFSWENLKTKKSYNYIIQHVPLSQIIVGVEESLTSFVDEVDIPETHDSVEARTIHSSPPMEIFNHALQLLEFLDAQLVLAQQPDGAWKVRLLVRIHPKTPDTSPLSQGSSPNLLLS